MNTEDSLYRLVKAAERIADALEKLVTTEPAHQAGLVLDAVAVPMIGGTNYHYAPDATRVDQVGSLGCGAWRRGQWDTARIVPIDQIPGGGRGMFSNRCYSPGCRRAFAAHDARTGTN